MRAASGGQGGFAGAAGGQGGLGAAAMGAPGGGQGEGAGAGAGGFQRRPVGGFTQMLSRLPEDQRKKVQDALNKELKGKKLEELTQEERREIFGKLREKGLLPQGAGRGGAGGAGAPGSEPALQGVDLQALAGRTGQFNEAQMANAKLPPPPEQDSQLDVLLRPGLLADVQIIVDKMTNVIYIPVQSVFEKANKPMVWVKNGSRFEERQIKPLKRSENTMIIADGLKENEIIALADPFAKPGTKGQDKPQSGSGSPMGGFSGGGGGGRSR